MRRTTIFMFAFVAAVSLSMTGSAQEGVMPATLELGDEQKAELKRTIEEELNAALKACVAGFPRPEYFTVVYTEYELKRSGRLTGGYIGGDTPDSNMYVESDEERSRREEDGSLARIVVRSDKQLDRCLKKETGNVDTGLNRYSGRISATYSVKWSGKSAKISATDFTVTDTK